MTCRVQVERLPDGCRIVMIEPRTASDAMLRRLKEARTLMDADLGDVAFPPEHSAFLYISEGARLLGCAIAEPIDGAYHALADAPREGLAETPTAATSGGVLRHDGALQPATCGVSHIWVTSDHRRRGIGRVLLDALRCASPWSPARAQTAASGRLALPRHKCATLWP